MITMIRFQFCFSFLLLASNIYGQSVLAPLTVEKIMRDPKWIGTSPTAVAWSPDSKTVYFNWNPENAIADSLYAITLQNRTPRKVNVNELINLPDRLVHFNKAKTKFTYEKNGDLFLYDVVAKTTSQITNTVGRELAPFFSGDEKKITFSFEQNIFSWEISSGKFSQLTDFRTGKKSTATLTSHEEWLRKDQLALFDVLKSREDKQQRRNRNLKSLEPKKPKEIYVDDRSVEMVQVSPNEKFITYKLTKKGLTKKTAVPSYVTTSGFTEDISARSKVGAPLNAMEFFVYDVIQDTVLQIKTSDLPGIADTPEYLKDYKSNQKDSSIESKKVSDRAVDFHALTWSDSGQKCVIIINSLDFKDRWIVSLDLPTQKLMLLHHDHDDAWIGGPVNGGFGNYAIGWMADNRRIWFTSEETGYSHLYTIDVDTKEKRQLTAGTFEVQQVTLSRNKDFFYLIANQSHPGEKHGYRLATTEGKLERLTTMVGAHEMVISPDEKMIAFRYSYSNTPWELYLMENKPGAKPQKITNSLTNEFKSYSWRDPELITFSARDTTKVYARIYRPEQTNGAAVIFVHGAGYLQNAHKWWSSYFREYMFHNLLADKGYTVLDIDYRASSGYGRNWRTAIYRHMGGKDLTDNLDGAKLLVEKYNIDPKRIGIYGGSYGGFITLMAMFTAPDVFAAGAALRPVTDWAHYSHSYTGSILNTPFLDSMAYAKSSPIYYAEGLKGALLMCHGVVDTNVHFQDAVRLSQRLIELGKENWELAVYPVEDHGFVEPSSWTDEYKRILKLFEENLKPK